jgi:hypothetical protein
MVKPGNKFRIPLPEKEALSLLLKVKPTVDMPRPRGTLFQDEESGKAGAVEVILT